MEEKKKKKTTSKKKTTTKKKKTSTKKVSNVKSSSKRTTSTKSRTGTKKTTNTKLTTDLTSVVEQIKKIDNNKKQEVSFDNALIIGMLLVLSIFIGFMSFMNHNSNTIEINNIKKEASNIIDKINKEEIVEKSIEVKTDNKKLLSSINKYLKDIYTNTNKINSIEKDIKDILVNKDIDKLKNYKEDINTSSDNLDSINKDNYKNDLDEKSIKVFDEILNKDIDKKIYNNKIKSINNDLNYAESIINFLNKNKSGYELKDNKLIFKNKNTYNEYIKLDRDVSINKISYEIFKDTEAPVITASDITFNVGNKIDLNSKLKCVDRIEGTVKCNIFGTYNSSKVGTYKLTIKAKDSSGNTSSKVITINVKGNSNTSSSKSSTSSSAPKSNGKPYYIEVIRNKNVVVVYGLDSNNRYTKIVKVFTVSVGKNGNTPTGTFKTTKGYRWGALFGGVYGQYSTRITGHILFHSVPYYKKNASTLEWEEYNKLGTAASAGCVRMRVIDVKWIFDHCPAGTTVKIYDGSLPKGVSKPVYAKIPSNSPNKGWDPTDPDKNNPWKK